VVRGDLPPAVFDSIRDALLEVDLADARERESWDESVRYGFAPASDADYDVVRRMANRVGGACGESCHSDVSF
jgi:ABC-type phosphate/phosphonate transport system substrate-binding protein